MEINIAIDKGAGERRYYAIEWVFAACAGDALTAYEDCGAVACASLVGLAKEVIRFCRLIVVGNAILLDNYQAKKNLLS